MDFKVFYKALGIASRIVEPTYYHILGIDPKECTEQQVIEAYHQKRMLLRQTIPGPRFIPLVARFEKEQLEPAFEVLRDDTLRKQYNQQLLERQKVIEEKNEKKAQLIEDVRRTIASTVDLQGMLGRQGRQILTERLRRLGVAEHNIRQILERIPTPLEDEADTPEDFDQSMTFYMEAVRISLEGGMPGPQETSDLLDLARRLGIDPDQARQILEDVARERPGQRASRIVLENEPGVIPDPVSQPAPISLEAQKETPREAGEQTVSEIIEQRRGIDLERLSHILIPAMTIGLFLLMFGVLFLVENGWIGSKQSADSPQQKASGSQQQNTEQQSVSPADEPDDPSMPQVEDNAKTTPAGGKISRNRIPQLQRADFREESRILRDGFGDEYKVDEVMGDVSVLMAAFLARLEQLEGTPGRWSRKYEKISIEPGARNLLCEQLREEIDYSLIPAGFDEQMAKLEEEMISAALDSDDLRIRIQTIDYLAEMQGQWPVEILLEELADTAPSTARQVTAGKILDVLSQKEPEIVAPRLAELLIRTSRQSAAHQIQMHLLDMAKQESTYGLPEILPLRHDALMRREIAGQWMDHYDSQAQRPLLGQPQPAQTDWLETDLERTAGVGMLAEKIDEKLKSLAQWEFGVESTRIDLDIAGEKGISNRLRDMVYTKAFLVLRAQDQTGSVGLDGAQQVLLDMSGELLDCEGTPCRWDVYAKAGARLAVEYAMLRDVEKRYVRVIETLWREYETRRRRAASKLAAIREGFYAQVVFWEAVAAIETYRQQSEPDRNRQSVQIPAFEIAAGRKQYSFSARANILTQRTQAKQKHNAVLDELIDALKEYLSGNFSRSRQKLESLTMPGFVNELSRGLNVADVDEFVQSCVKFENNPLEEGVAVYCTACGGSGREKCPKCSGRGRLRSAPGRLASSGFVQCGDCYPPGSGSLRCSRCGGTGIEPGVKIHDPEIDQWFIQARKLLQYAVYLRQGGIDIHP